jgi:hypothetical protein
MLEMTTNECWAVYGIMWVITFSLLYISHKVDASTKITLKDSE